MKKLIKQIFCNHIWIEKEMNCECKIKHECEKCKKTKLISIYEIHKIL